MPEHVAAAAQLACLLEASAPKPGNVSPGRDFPDARYEDFLASAVAIREPLAGAGARPLGATIRLAVESTARWTPSNTNLGIVLLIAPIARAALVVGFGRHVPDSARKMIPDTDGHDALRAAVRADLDATTVQDTRDVYAAIRCARPGGLGAAREQDVRDEPTVALLDAMRLAADRDGIAREYATGFETTFEVGVPALEHARTDGLRWNDAVVELFLTLLAARPDTHIARRGGTALSGRASALAAATLARGGVRSQDGREAIDAMDRELRDARHLGSPGTTADLTAASIFVWLLRQNFSDAGNSGPRGPGGP
jgi:triphosphoribosyl-dephospho-CoA synthase